MNDIELLKVKSPKLSGTALKTIAIITMLIDHIGAVLVPSDSLLYATLRLIGRISFPVFCFLLVEGYSHTSNFKKYVLRLGCFALLSEVPYDLAFHNSIFYPEKQNVFFTLLIGLCVMRAYTYIVEKTNNRYFTIVPVIFGCLLAYLIRCDYNITGIIYIVLLFVLKDHKTFRNIAFALGVPIMIYVSAKPNFASLIDAIPFIITNLQLWAVLALIPINFYNGEKGKISINKYVFYLFYPVHLLVLYGISFFINSI